MKIIYSNTSPYSRKIRVLACELGCNNDIEWVHSHPFDDEYALIQSNPLGRVPTLVVTGQLIVDSSVIADYLLATFAPSAEPFDATNWSQRSLSSLAHGLLDSAVAWHQDDMRPTEQRSAFWRGRYRAAIVRTLAYFNQRLEQFGCFPALESITLACALEYLQFRHPQLTWDSRNTELANWLAPLAKRESMQSTQPHK